MHFCLNSAALGQWGSDDKPAIFNILGTDSISVVQLICSVAGSKNCWPRWMFPLLGHVGIADSQGLIHDFITDFVVQASSNSMLFGPPCRYPNRDQDVSNFRIIVVGSWAELYWQCRPDWVQCPRWLGSKDSAGWRQIFQASAQNFDSELPFTLGRLPGKRWVEWIWHLLGRPHQVRDDSW